MVRKLKALCFTLGYGIAIVKRPNIYLFLYGQLHISSKKYVYCKIPVNENQDLIKLKQIKTCSHHACMLKLGEYWYKKQ